MTDKLAEWSDTPGHPWRRFLARTFDNCLLGVPIWWLIGAAAYLVSLEVGDALISFLSSFWGRLIDGMLTLAIMIPVQSLLIGLTGSSPGKWLCGIRVRRRDNQLIGVGAALWRELQVWTIGYAAGLPLVSLFTLSRAYAAVHDSGVADWDGDDGSIVTYRPIIGFRGLLIGLAILFVVVVAGWGLVERLTTRLQM